MQALVFRPQAEQEVLAIQWWYEERHLGLGHRFGQAIHDALTRIAENPLAFPLAHRDIRRAVLARFPYAIYFRAVHAGVVVLAVHGRQHPSHWKTRE